MENFISNLRNKPERIRMGILWVSVFVCMIIVGGIWFIDLRSKIQQSSADTSLKQVVNSLVEDVDINNAKSNMQLNVSELIKKNNQESDIVESQTEEKVESKIEQGKAYQLPIE